MSTRRTPEPPDFLRPVLALEQRSLGARLSGATVLALVLHSAVAFGAATSIGLGKFAALVLDRVQAELAEREVDLVQDPPPPEPEPEPPPPEPPPPEPEAPPPPAPTPVEPPPEAPPATAQAGNVLTAEPDPNEPLDFTDRIVVGTGDSYAGGQTSATGKSKVAVHNPRAVPTGVVGGRGTTVNAVPAVSRAREARTLNQNWDCGFPPEAEMDQVSGGRVQIAVTVGADGRAKSVTVLKDPGHGFGRRARQCALTMPYAPALDVQGRPITKTTPPFWVTFRPPD